MGKTIKQIADEIGISKQAVYKRVTGKLKHVCAPYIYTEYNRMCLTEEGENIVKRDFIDNPCATPPLTERIQPGYDAEQNQYGANTPHTERSGVLHTERIQNSSGANTPMHTEHIQPAPGADTEYIQPHTERIDENSKTHTEYSASDTKQVGSTYNSHTEHSVSDMEQIGNTYGAHTDITAELEEKKNEIHKLELELVKAKAEIDKLNAIIVQLNQRIEDKNLQIEEQRELITRTEGERKILTASLFKNNEFIGNILHLSLSKRIFGWNEVQKQITESQNNTAADVAGETAITVPYETDET